MASNDPQQTVVIGAGVSGLTSAICLAEAGWPVRVWTAAPPQQTTSRVAGALWAPPRPRERAVETLAWTEHSLRVFRELANDPTTGVRMRPALTAGDLSGEDAMSSAATLIPELRAAEPDDMPEGFRMGFRATMPMIDMPHYLDYLTQRLATAGCEIEMHPVRSLAEAADAAPIVVNCAGLGAGALGRRRHGAAAVRTARRGHESRPAATVCGNQSAARNGPATSPTRSAWCAAASASPTAGTPPRSRR